WLWVCCLAWAALLAGTAVAEDERDQKDLVRYADRAMRGFMVTWPEPIPDPPGALRTCFDCMHLPVPRLSHAQWDWGDCTARAARDWLYVREMTGDRDFGRDVEEGQRQALLSCLAPETGMVFVPERSRPDQGVYHYQAWDQGRTLRALVWWWLAETDSARKAEMAARIDRMVAGLSALAVRGHDPVYGPYAVYPFDYTEGDRHGDDLRCMRAGQLVEPLAVYWENGGGAQAREFADEIVAGILSGHEGDTYAPPIDGWFRFGEDGAFHHHFHAHTSTVLGVARMGQALVRKGERAKGLPLLEWAKRVYDWTLSPANANAGSTWGWFPENMGSDNTQAREISEICCTADMIELASVLAESAALDARLASWDALWDHVERYTLNTIVPAQFSVTPRYRRLLERSLRDRVAAHNGYIELELDRLGAYNHEIVGHQTLRVAGIGHLSQAVYAVEYDGQRAWCSYVPGQPTASRGLAVESATHREGDALAGSVRTEDGRLRIDHGAACGRGPYVLRTFSVTNTSAEPLAGARLACATNLDSPTWSAEQGTIADGCARIAARGEEPCVGLKAEPRPAFMSLSEAGPSLAGEKALDWSAPRDRYFGNSAVLVGWELGTLSPGETRAVTMVMAVGSSGEELDRALRQETFPPLEGGSALEIELRRAERLNGSWVATFFPNDLAALGPDSTLTLSAMGCCPYAGVRALYSCWKPALADDAQTISARYAIDRVSAVAVQEAMQDARRVTQSISLLAGRALRVRLPDWAHPSSVLATGGGGRRVPFHVRGQWLEFGRLAAGSEVTVSYPVRLRVTRERVGGAGTSQGFAPADQKRTFTAYWRGNIVVRVEPRGELMPMFE
ncbi:MAG TPA: hypothetical protein PLQ54_10555, partial [Armatimonadota bacterium]|nr:hypothetical protein [Armatimonadota bacterium]